MAELKVIKSRRDEHKDCVVEILTEALTRAKAGEVIGCGIAMVLQDNTMYTILASSDVHGTLTGACSQLLYRINRQGCEDPNEIPPMPKGDDA